MAGRKKKESQERKDTRTLTMHKGLNMVTQEVYDMRTTSDGKKARSIEKYFGTDRLASIAYFVSSMIAKGYNDEEVLVVVNQRFTLEWDLKRLSTMKELCRMVWRTQMIADINDMIAEEVNAINTQLRELWIAWEESKKGTTKTRHRHESSVGLEGVEDTNYDITEEEEQTENSPGDIKYMAQINELGKEKRKLLGLYKKEQKNAGPTGTAIQINVVGGGAAESLGTILNQGSTEGSDAIDGTAEVVESLPEGAKVPVMAHSNEIDLEQMYNEMMLE